MIKQVGGYHIPQARNSRPLPRRRPGSLRTNLFIPAKGRTPEYLSVGYYTS
ncbi:hypothetical protein HMPREF1548_01512 [Clostridium sp. KLE 1755]|nr:hypothetical protein HMPREF1548_01512 [Clostridium sp. KLE 1755]